MSANPASIIIGISGASGACYGIRLLELLQPLDIQTHLIISKSAALTIHAETDLTLKQVKALADVTHDPLDMGASISSGSYPTLGMIIAPCSMKTLAEVASGMSNSLIGRAADVVLKECRRLVLMPRETPFNHIHLTNMVAVSQAGGIMAPPVPAFYNRPESLDDIVNHSCQRVLDLFDIQAHQLSRWEGM